MHAGPTRLFTAGLGELTWLTHSDSSINERLDDAATQSATRQPVSQIRRQRPATRIWAKSRISSPAIAIVSGLPDLCTIWRLSSGYTNHLWALLVDLAPCSKESQPPHAISYLSISDRVHYYSPAVIRSACSNWTRRSWLGILKRKRPVLLLSSGLTTLIINFCADFSGVLSGETLGHVPSSSRKKYHNLTGPLYV